MEAPLTAAGTPFAVDVIAGTDYWWCACGRSRSQPFCDGSHGGTGLQPLKFSATVSATVWFCGCKRAARAPLCDGSHNRLSLSPSA
jgi:CDGSH-type Zn-finger protein